ncbi:MAG TPA: glycosyltransferase [Phycisphaeraceae bacterium]
MSTTIGAVAIGRNEGPRLQRCLQSLIGQAQVIVYVDSGSTDVSVELARSLGAIVVELDLAQPFSMARARNAGFERLLQEQPDLRYIQFVDGDCEVVAGWVEQAAAVLDTQPQTAVVCGRRRERHPQASIYNRLCDLEWDTPIGPAKACGGDALMRVQALQQVGGYNPDLIAGEEPELCVRLREHGWQVLRIDAPMTLHDAAMTRFDQWWKRTRRAGYAYANGAYLHGRGPQRHNMRELASILLWGLALPLLALALAWPTRGISLLVLAAGEMLLGWRVYRHQRRRGRSASDARLYAAFTVLGKPAQAMGAVQFFVNRLLRRPSRLIEYKDAPQPQRAQA